LLQVLDGVQGEPVGYAAQVVVTVKFVETMPEYPTFRT
jgi:hypothetical protein